MHATTNSALVWKKLADENQQSAQLMARISIVLAILLACISAYAFSTNARFNDLCATIETNAHKAAAQPAREFGTSIASSYCG